MEKIKIGLDYQRMGGTVGYLRLGSITRILIPLTRFLHYDGVIFMVVRTFGRRRGKTLVGAERRVIESPRRCRKPNVLGKGDTNDGSTSN